MGKSRGIKRKSPSGNTLAVQLDMLAEGSNHPSGLMNSLASDPATSAKGQKELMYRHTAPEFDPARSLIAIHPGDAFIAVAWGSRVYVLCRRSSSLLEIPGADQQQAVRALAFDRHGRYLLAAGDSKICCTWDCQGWNIILRTVAPKKISAATFTFESKQVLMADKFGDVYITNIPEQASTDSVTEGEGLVSKPHMLLGHFSSIITSLTALPGNSGLVSSDREGKIRISKLPKDPMQGASSIQSFCLGHTAFVTTVAFLDWGEGRLLASGSGDGTIRLWDPIDGREIDCFDTALHLEAATPAQSTAEAQGLETPEQSGEAPNEVQQDTVSSIRPEQEDNVEEDMNDQSLTQVKLHENLPPAVVDLVSQPDGTTLVAAVEGEPNLLVFDVLGQKLSLIGRVPLPQVALPTSLAVNSQGRLFGVGGCVESFPFTIGLSADIVWSQEEASASKGADPFPALEIIRSAIRSSSNEQPGLADLAAKPGTQVSLELRKWCYSAEEITRRKSRKHPGTHS